MQLRTFMHVTHLHGHKCNETRKRVNAMPFSVPYCSSLPSFLPSLPAYLPVSTSNCRAWLPSKINVAK